MTDKTGVLTSNEMGFWLEDYLNVLCERELGDISLQHRQALNDRIDAVRTCLASMNTPETCERRLAEACECMRRAAALVAMAGDQSMALAIYDHSRRLLGDVPPWWDSENTQKANSVACVWRSGCRNPRLCGEMGCCQQLGADKASKPRTESILDRKVTVCASCLCASCWQGDFYCDNYKTANTVDKTVRELFQINANGVREDSGYWFKDPSTGKVDYDAKSAAKRAFNALSEPV